MSADGKTLATHYNSGAVTVWDVTTGKVRVTLSRSWSENTFLLLSPDGKVLFTNKIALERWDAVSGRSLGTLLPRGKSKIPPVLTPNGRWMAALGAEIKVWEVVEAECQECGAFKVEDSSKAKALAISDDGHSGGPGFRREFKGRTGIRSPEQPCNLGCRRQERATETQQRRKHHRVGVQPRWQGVLHGQWERCDSLGRNDWRASRCPGASRIASTDFDTQPPDNKVLIGSSGYNSGVTLWDLQSGKVRTFVRSARAPHFLLPDGVSLLSLGDDGAVRRWNLDEADRQFVKGTAHYDSVKRRTVDRKYTPDGKFQVLLPTGAFISLHDGRTDAMHGKVVDLPRQYEVLFSPDSKTMAMVTDGSARLCDSQTGKDHGTIAGVTGDLAFSPIGSFCVAEVGTRTREIAGYHRDTWHNYVNALKIWDMAAGREVSLLKEAQGPVVFSPDGKLFAAVEGGPRDPKDAARTPRRTPVRVKVWETATGRERASIDMTDPVVFSPDAGALLVRNGNTSPSTAKASPNKGRVRPVRPTDLVMWDLAADGARFTLEDVDLREWSPGQTKIVVDDTKNPPFQSAPTIATRRRVNVAYSPDGKLLATANSSGSVILWETANGTETLRLRDHTGPVTIMAFTSTARSWRPAAKIGRFDSGDISTGRGSHTLRVIHGPS